MGEGGHTGSAELAVLPSSSSSSTRRSQFFFPAVSDWRVSAVLGVGVDERGVDGPATDEVIGVDEASREGQLIDSALASMSSSWTISSSADARRDVGEGADLTAQHTHVALVRLDGGIQWVER